jgi:hypothetical protein
MFRQNYSLEDLTGCITRPRHWLLDYPEARRLFLTRIWTDASVNDNPLKEDSAQYDDLMDQLIDGYRIREWKEPSNLVEVIRTDLKLNLISFQTLFGLH